MHEFFERLGAFFVNSGDDDLRGADLGGADLRGVDLRKAELREANLRDAIIDETTLLDAEDQLVWEIVNQGAEGRRLWGAQLNGADLRNAKLARAELSDAKPG